MISMNKHDLTYSTPFFQNCEAYAVTQGVSESITGVLMGVSAVFGLIGTCVYPALHRRTGLARTGIIALTCQVSCLALCVVSIWMPGSPFDPFCCREALAVNSTPVSLANNLNNLGV